MDAETEPQDTVFYLLGANELANEVINSLEDGDSNGPRITFDTPTGDCSALRIQTSHARTADRLAQFGRWEQCEIVLPQDFCDLECYIDVNPVSDGTGSQCAIVLCPDTISEPNESLDREYHLEIGSATFLIHAPVGDGQRIPSQEMLSERIRYFGAQSWWPYRDYLESVPLAHIKLRRLGIGAQGTVYHVVSVFDGCHFACKVMDVTVYIRTSRVKNTASYKDHLRREVGLVREARSREGGDHIAEYLRAEILDRGREAFIYMYVYDGSVADLIRGRWFEEEATKKLRVYHMASQISSALCSLSTSDRTTRARALIHRDIKPENILFKNQHYVLSDFGLAKAVDRNASLVGTEMYKAPEMANTGRNSHHTPAPHTTKIDIYSLGITMVVCYNSWSAEDIFQNYSHNMGSWRSYAKMKLAQFAGEDFACAGAILESSPVNRPAARTIRGELGGYINGIDSHYPTHLPPLDWTSTFDPNITQTQSSGQRSAPAGEGSGEYMHNGERWASSAMYEPRCFDSTVPQLNPMPNNQSGPSPQSFPPDFTPHNNWHDDDARDDPLEDDCSGDDPIHNPVDVDVHRRLRQRRTGPREYLCHRQRPCAAGVGDSIGCFGTHDGAVGMGKGDRHGRLGMGYFGRTAAVLGGVCRVYSRRAGRMGCADQRPAGVLDGGLRAVACIAVRVLVHYRELLRQLQLQRQVQLVILLPLSSPPPP
ncbi:calcium calmodulin-dependent protein kinase [Ophiostoma piceae UAMH 11346]|uniref:non-specific serine/threonine protein kinase n=1 Tax=Ophiostoma piceae (strain UAMH 11346) TaxID=1262450 RepID=S3CQJ0_OPHP1|nr:calcium calmodulin-dependent protein kinase [Ophiostoma piceae UAMH 11346]